MRKYAASTPPGSERGEIREPSQFCSGKVAPEEFSAFHQARPRYPPASAGSESTGVPKSSSAIPDQLARTRSSSDGTEIFRVSLGTGAPTELHCQPARTVRSSVTKIPYGPTIGTSTESVSNCIEHSSNGDRSCAISSLRIVRGNRWCLWVCALNRVDSRFGSQAKSRAFSFGCRGPGTMREANQVAVPPTVSSSMRRVG